MVFNTAELIKHEYSATTLKGYIGICLYILPVFACTFVVSCILCRLLLMLRCLDADMVLNEEKRNRLAGMLTRR